MLRELISVISSHKCLRLLADRGDLGEAWMPADGCAVGGGMSGVPHLKQGLKAPARSLQPFLCPHTPPCPRPFQFMPCV